MVRPLRSKLPLWVGLFAGVISLCNPIFAEQKTKLVHIPFEKAETELLSRFQQDLPRLERIADKVALYQVAATGNLPSDYSMSLRQHLEEILLTSRGLQLIDCANCQVSRLIKDSEGNLKYETFSEEPGRPAKVASEIGVEYLVYADLNYTPSDIQLRVRMIRPASGEVAWTNEYSTANIISDRQRIVGREYGIEQTQADGSVSHIVIGEIAFSFVFSPGVAWLPTIDQGYYGSSRAMYPSLDILIGEKYDNGHKRFGFLFGAITKAAEDDAYTKHLPWAIRIAPQFRYTFNPYNTSAARVSLITEVGGLISSQLATAYLLMGPEFQMVKRFSVALLPMFILPTSVKGQGVLVEDPDGTFRTEAPAGSQGRFGGFGVLLKGSMNW
jgi:hypothetical protein